MAAYPCTVLHGVPMYNALISGGAGAAVFAVVAFFFQPIAAVLPAIIVLGVVYYLLARRVGRAVEREMAAAVKHLQSRRIDEAVAAIRATQARWRRWQFLLDAQLDAQLGMISYLQTKWDEAMPLLERGKWRNWMALTCIACIHYRQGRKEEAWKAFDKAVSAGKKEPMIYVIQATLLTREDKRDEALAVLAQGLKALPDSKLLSSLRETVANKKKVDTKAFPQTWYQFFPEDLARQALPQVPRPGAVPGVSYPMPKFSRKGLRGR